MMRKLFKMISISNTITTIITMSITTVLYCYITILLYDYYYIVRKGPLESVYIPSRSPVLRASCSQKPPEDLVIDGGSPKLGVPIRITVFCGLYWSPPISEDYQILPIRPGTCTCTTAKAAVRGLHGDLYTQFNAEIVGNRHPDSQMHADQQIRRQAYSGIPSRPLAFSHLWRGLLVGSINCFSSRHPR